MPPSSKDLAEQNARLTERLALLCKENTSLTAEVGQLQKKNSELSKIPYDPNSVLTQMHDPKSGWFAGGKKGSKDQMQKLCDSLQQEYVQYSSTHTRSDAEVERLMKQLQASQSNASELATMLSEERSNRSNTKEVNELKEELQEKQREIARLQKASAPLRAAGAAAGGADAEVGMLRTEVNTLSKELEAARQSLTAEQSMHKMKVEECQTLTQRLEDMRSKHQSEVAALRTGAPVVAKSCQQCAQYTKDMADVRARCTTLEEELKKSHEELTLASASADKKYVSLQSRLTETEQQLTKAAKAASVSVPREEYESLDKEKKVLAHDVSLYKERISHLEALNKAYSTGDRKGLDVDDERMLNKLEDNKERISTLEFEKSQLSSEVEKLQASLDEATTRNNADDQDAAENKEKLTFFLKKSAALTASSRKLEKEKATLSESLLASQAEVQRCHAEIDGLSNVRSQYDSLAEEKEQMTSRLAEADLQKDELSKAKETIRYMELAQSRTVSLTQHAELQSHKQKLEQEMGVLKKKLEDTSQELSEAKEKLAVPVVVPTGDGAAVGAALSDGDVDVKALTDQVQHLKGENTRLIALNTSLDSQMKDMQDGISEMAIHMEKERSSARAVAEKASEKEMAALREELERAKSTIAGVQATDGQFVSEGLYLSAVEEKQELLDEVQRKTIELEKMKSEVLIYRQTIAELEMENDEHVKGIEELQDTLEEERTAAEQRDVESEKQLVSTQEKLTELNELLLQQGEALEANKVTIEELRAKESQNEKLNGAAAGALLAGEAAAVPKKKPKKVKKKKSLADQLYEGDDDVLLAASPAKSADVSDMALQPAQQDEQAHPRAALPIGSSHELERLQTENVHLKKTIQRMSSESEQPEELARISEENSRLRRDLQTATDNNESMKTELSKAKAECKRARTLGQPMPVAPKVSEKEKKLEQDLTRTQKELNAVSSQLLPVKEKLSEYVAMADRIGLSYPFSVEHEQQLARKLRHIKKHSIL